MNTRRLFFIAACAALLIFSGAATAQEADREMPAPQERGFKPIPVSPEKSARHTTDRMNSLLNLTERQYEKLYKLDLKWAREDMKTGCPHPAWVAGKIWSNNVRSWKSSIRNVRRN